VVDGQVVDSRRSSEGRLSAHQGLGVDHGVQAEEFTRGEVDRPDGQRVEDPTQLRVEVSRRHPEFDENVAAPWAAVWRPHPGIVEKGLIVRAHAKSFPGVIKYAVGGAARGFPCSAATEYVRSEISRGERR
jgi:hypothetical protein